MKVTRGHDHPATMKGGWPDRFNYFHRSNIDNSRSHPGFQNVASGIAARQGVSMARASAMLAAGTRRASTGARKANPRLNRVKGY